MNYNYNKEIDSEEIDPLGSFIDMVIEKANEIKRKLDRNGPIGRLKEDIELLISIIKDYKCKKYTKVPYWVIGAAVFILFIWVLYGLDSIPDSFPFVGKFNDIAIVSIFLLLIEKELQEYKRWKTNHDRTNMDSSQLEE